MKQELFGMRRANGDWFAVDVADARRVALFRSLTEAWRARAKNDELMLFWPAPIEGNVLTEFATADNGKPARFWLVDEDEPAANLLHGHPLEYLQLATLEGPAEVAAPLRGTVTAARPTSAFGQPSAR